MKGYRVLGHARRHKNSSFGWLRSADQFLITGKRSEGMFTKHSQVTSELGIFVFGAMQALEQENDARLIAVYL